MRRKNISSRTMIGDILQSRPVKAALAWLLVYSGIVWIIRRTLWRDDVLILVYHNPTPDTLDKHLRYLCRFCDIIPMSQIDRPGNKRPRAVVTFDDGYARNVSLLSVFKKYDIYPTIYICSEIVGTCRQFWWTHPAARKIGLEELKKMPNAERLRCLKSSGFRQDQEDVEPAALTKEDMLVMRQWIEFGSHSRFHPILTACNDKECATEIVGSRQAIEKLVNRECFHFAYPNGNYSRREITILKAAGYKSARTLDLGWNNSSTDPFRLKALPLDDSGSVLWLAAQLSLLPTFLRYLSYGSFFGRAPQIFRTGAQP
jgi:peptidoglycan/xylan/chitin deacetylase (PgdA/CDA1 family)